MRKKWIAAAALAALLITIGLGAALAAPGTASDPFVSRSYLTNTYYAQVKEAMLQQAKAGTARTEQAAMDRLEALSSRYGGQTQPTDQKYAGTFCRMTLSRGDRLELPTGSGLLFEAGRGQLAFTSGALVDVTAGTALTQGSTLTTGHRYVAAENTTCTLTALTDAVILSVQGYYDLEATGKTYTPFTDLAETDWFYEAALYAYEEGLFQGDTPTTFSPNNSMTRAQLATVLSRQAGFQGTAPSAGFRDVPAGQWYANAVNWAAGNGIITGMGDNLFSPDTNVSREQMVTMLYRYARNYLKLELPVTGSLSAFPDGSKVSDWAREAMAWAVGVELIKGDDLGYLLPGNSTTRAQMATVFQRFAALLAQMTAAN